MKGVACAVAKGGGEQRWRVTPQDEMPTPPVCTCSSASPRVAAEETGEDARFLLDSSAPSERNIELLPPELHQKPEKVCRV